MDMINLLSSLALAILANMLLGSITSIVDKKFDWIKLGKGLIKSAVILASIALLWGAGVLSPDVKVLDDWTIIMGVEAITLMSFVWYGGQAILKLKNIMYPQKETKKDIK